MKITKVQAEKVLKTVDKGLSYGLGERKPGFMCIEAAVCYAFGEPHNDKPTCVDEDLREIKITLNDMVGVWKSKKDRANGLRRLAIAQLGSINGFNEKKFWTDVNDMVLAKVKTILFERIQKAKSFESLFEISMDEIYSIGHNNDFYNMSNNLNLNINKAMHWLAEVYTQALIKQKIPGTKYLYLTKNKPIIDINSYKIT